MFLDVHRSRPRCPLCQQPMRLVHVLTNKHVYPPVRTFECPACQREAIFQWQPAHDGYRDLPKN